MDVLCAGFGMVESPRRPEGRPSFTEWDGQLRERVDVPAVGSPAR